MIKNFTVEKIEDLKLLLDSDVINFTLNWPRGVATKFQYPYGNGWSKYTKTRNSGVPEDVYTSCLTCLVFGGNVSAEKEVFYNYE